MENPQKAKLLQGFFKTGPGEYGEGDVFLGIQVPVLRMLAREFDGLPMPAVRSLLDSPLHESRLLALLLLVREYTRGNDADKRRIYDFYLASTSSINNWDLVDLSAPRIVGDFLAARSRAPLRRLAKSDSLWERRIAIVATYRFICDNDFGATLAIAQMLLRDHQDLIHKATGWMLREVGKRDTAALEGFLDQHCRAMPRTMLRYAIERFPEARRQQYLKASKPGLQR
jgi:3-methyladenine DNA glycosylase AlkD